MSTSKIDLLTIIGKGSVGAIPFIGPLAAEIVGAIIPNQRIDRLEQLLITLESKISESEKDNINSKLNSVEGVDLLEDGFISASRALSSDRLDYIASLLKNSLTEEQMKHSEYKRLLNILNQINDVEVLILKSYAMNHFDEKSKEFREKHENILYVQPTMYGSTQDEMDKYVIHQTHRNNLAALNLLKPRFKRLKKGELPEFDEKTGMIKASGHTITSLGNLLLRVIDQTEDIN